MRSGKKEENGSKRKRKRKKNYIAKRQKGMENMGKRSEDDAVGKVVDKILDNEENPAEIKNCPFCGGHASLLCKNTPSGSVEFAKCECDNCHAVIGVGRTEIVEFVKELCIAKWNKRVIDSTERSGG